MSFIYLLCSQNRNFWIFNILESFLGFLGNLIFYKISRFISCTIICFFTFFSYKVCIKLDFLKARKHSKTSVFSHRCSIVSLSTLVSVAIELINQRSFSSLLGCVKCLWDRERKVETWEPIIGQEVSKRGVYQIMRLGLATNVNKK